MKTTTLLSVCLFSSGSCMWPFGPEAESSYYNFNGGEYGNPGAPAYTGSMEPPPSQVYDPCAESPTYMPSTVAPVPTSTSSLCTCPETTEQIPTQPSPCNMPYPTKIAWPTPAVHASVTLPPCVNLTAPEYCNITTAFRLAPVQDEWWQAQQFCLSRPQGVYCYVPVGCTDCFPTVMISCPGAVFLACREGQVCAEGGCRAMVDLFPNTVWSYGGVRRVMEDERIGYVVRTNQGEETWVPKKCRGPMPLAMERCIRNLTQTTTINPTDFTDDPYTRAWQLPTPTGTTMCDVF